ncbi:MAG: DNA primase [Parcubacteria group bacterium GW2011_GWA2_38_13b]|nr:MAG: DNA primase [Parcubacteria group bacterium GW2011_GWA2_38_13b]
MTDLEEIKSRLDIADIIRGYLHLEKAGANWKARCPFHNEKSPSFMVSSDKQIWHCFGCGEGGDVFGFLMKIDGLEFKEALKILAERAGVKLQRQPSGDYAKEKNKKEIFYEINEWATKFFEKQLWGGTPASKKIMEYLRGRGLKEETIKNFRLGYAPKEWRLLRKFLNSKGYKDGDVAEAGLIINSIRQPAEKIQNFDYHDRFRGRVMFPIADIQGRVAGFTGRVFDPLFTKEELEKQGKYVNSPETIVYNKSKILYGLDKAKLALRKKNVCILVEGNTDLIMSHQAGVENAVAVSGTALTEMQIGIIKRYTENLIIAFDNDEAGNLAAKRSIDLAMRGGLNVKVITIKGAKDPADILKEKDGALKWQTIIDSSQGVVDFYFGDVFLKYSADSAENKRKITQALLPVVRKVQNKVEQYHWLRVLAEHLNVREEFLIEALNSIKVKKTGSYGGTGEKNQAVETRDAAGENLIGLVIKYYESGHCDLNLPENLSFSDARFGEIYDCFLSIVKNGKKISDFYGELSDENGNLVKKMIFIVEKRWEDETLIKNDIDFLIKKIQFRKVKADLNCLALDIKKAEAEKNKKEIDLLKKEFQKLAEQLK